MNVITKKMIKDGIKTNQIRFVTDPNSGKGTVCQIGEFWFYFGGFTAEQEEPETYLKNVGIEDTVNEIFDVLQEFRKDEELKDEYEHYYWCLKQSSLQLDTMLTLSIAHISPYVNGVLHSMADNDEGFDGFVVYLKDNVGFFLYPNETGTFPESESFPKCLRDIFKLANSVNATIICLDSDGRTVEGLMAYNY